MELISQHFEQERKKMKYIHFNKYSLLVKQMYLTSFKTKQNKTKNKLRLLTGKLFFICK